MSLRAVLTPVPSRSCRSVPALVACSGNRSFGHSIVNGPKVASLKHSNLRSYYYSRSTRFGPTVNTFQARRRPARLQTTSLQAVTAYSDSSSSDAVSSSDCAMNLPTAWSGPENLKPFFDASLHGMHEGLRNLKERGLRQSSKEGLEDAYSKLKTIDGKSALQSVSRSKFVTQGTRVWQTLEPWIKWPIAIFVGIFLVIFAFTGMTVVQDLVPLWIMGPLITGLIIRSAYSAADFTQKSFVRTKPLQQRAMGCTVQLYEDAKNGELIDKLRVMIELKNKEWKEETAKKKSDFTSYVKSGQVAADFKVFLLLKFSQLNEWSTEKYEDFAEWVRPFWRAFTRLMKKLF